ncbi:MAG TPA: hypothetical protein VN643_21640 [Pyrinomonadaceae bacterium]|nr:hypothetical protein [Pyrinomonadaceae bacterium]
MKYRFKIMSSTLGLTFMLLFGAVAFAHTTNKSMAKPVMSSARMMPASKDRWDKHKHHRHHRRHHRHWRR